MINIEIRQVGPTSTVLWTGTTSVYVPSTFINFDGNNHIVEATQWYPLTNTVVILVQG